MSTSRQRKPVAVDTHGARTFSVPMPVSLLARQLGVPVDELSEDYAERAAIREYLGNASRATAEADALSDLAEIVRVRYRRLF